MSEKKIVSLKAGSNPSVLNAIKLMLRNKVGSVVLVNEYSRPVGIVTERDVLRKVSTSRKALGEIKAKSIMSRPVITVKPYDSVETAAAIMAKMKVKRLVVIDEDGSMEGVISLTDITKKLAKILTDEQNRFGNLKALLGS